MLLPEWLYEVLPYLCVIATLANASWDFQQVRVKSYKVVQQVKSSEVGC